MRLHIHNLTLRHWDSAMRDLGARASGEILKLSEEEVVRRSLLFEVSLGSG